MRFSVIFSNFLILMATILVCMDATSSAASGSLVFIPGRRSIGKWSHSYNSQQGDHNVKGFTLGSRDQVGERGAKSKTEENSKPYFTETQNSSDIEVEEIVYNIDYHGATTHPTPTPRHPKP